MGATREQLETIGVAIIGAGFMGSVHAEALHRLGVRLVGALGVTPDESRQAVAMFGAGRAYADLEELLADPEVHAVHILTPNRFHHEMAVRAIGAGKHVMCEKPLAMTSAETGGLVELAAAHPDLVTGVNYNNRFYPLCIEAHERIARGDLGRIFHVCGSYTQDWLIKETDYNWRVLAEEGGLRAVADIGTHWLDLAQHVTGRRIASVCADLKTVYPTRQRPLGEVETFSSGAASSRDTESIDVTTEDYGALLMRFEDDTRATLWVSQVNAGRKNRLSLEIAGEHGALAWENERPNELWLGRRDEPSGLMLRDPSLLTAPASAATTLPGGHNEGFADTFKQCFASFYGRIVDPASPARYATFADGDHEVRLCEAIARSAAERRWVEVDRDS